VGRSSNFVDFVRMFEYPIRHPQNFRGHCGGDNVGVDDGGAIRHPQKVCSIWEKGTGWMVDPKLWSVLLCFSVFLIWE